MPNPGKGDRVPITVRVPPEHKTRYEAEASRLGLPLSDYLALKIAELHGLKRPKWIRTPDRREVLPRNV